MVDRNTGLAVALLAAAALLPASPAAAQQATSFEQRLRELESAYTELLVRDGEKAREIERLRGEVSGLRQGKRDAGATPDHGHDHGKAAKEVKESPHDHDHADAHDHAAESGGDVLLESGGFRVYVPSIGIDMVAYRDDSSPDLEERLGTLRGFGHAHGEGDDEHAQLTDGFVLRHAEVGFAAEAVGYGRAQGSTPAPTASSWRRPSSSPTRSPGSPPSRPASSAALSASSTSTILRNGSSPMRRWRISCCSAITAWRARARRSF
jgi:hypothetical protein